MNNNPNQVQTILSLKNQITKDGRISKEDVDILRDFLQGQDGVLFNMDREKADLLFDLFNSAKNEEVVDKSFIQLFKESVCAYLLKDQSSAGILDNSEVDWLVEKIEMSKSEDEETIFELVKELKSKSFNNFPEKLDSAIILRRLRVILDLLSNLEADNGCKETLANHIKSLNNFLKRRKKFSVDEDCVAILFSVKKKIVQNKHFNIKENLNNEKTVEYKFAKLFYDIVSAVVLNDENSPYEVDEDEAELLMKNINQNANADIIDKHLLEQLKDKSMSFPELLAKAHFDLSTSSVRTNVVNALVGKTGEKEEVKKQLKDYLDEPFDCFDEQKLKAELLFDLKNLTNGQEKDIESFIQNQFVERVTEYITGESSQSPNEIDDEDEKWLKKRLEVSGSRYYECDEELLRRLKDSSVNFPESLEERLSKVIMKRIFIKLKTQGETLNNTYVKELRDAIFNDNDEFKIDPKEAAEFIFRIKDSNCEKERVSFVQQLKSLIIGIKRFFFKVQQYLFPSGKEYGKDSFGDLFVEVVSSYLLGDKDSPGKIDEAETEWLLARINQNQETDRYDKALLKALEERSINHPNVLHYIGYWKNSLRQSLFISRKICWIAIISCVIASIFLFAKGSAHVGSGLFAQRAQPVMVVDSSQMARIKYGTGLTGDTILVQKILLQNNKKLVKNVQIVADRNFLTNGEKAILGVSKPDRIVKKYDAKNNVLQQKSIQLKGIRDVKGIVGYASVVKLKLNSIQLVERKNAKWIKSFKNENSFVEIVEGIDSFLVALVVFILGIGIYELFIRKMEKPYKVNDKRPSWMQMNSIDDLKSSLVKVLIIAMIVGFYKMTLTSPLDKKSLLALAIGIVLIAIAFCVTEISAHYHHKSKEEETQHSQDDNTNEENKAKEDKHNKDDNNKKEK